MPTSHNGCTNINLTPDGGLDILIHGGVTSVKVDAEAMAFNLLLRCRLFGSRFIATLTCRTCVASFEVLIGHLFLSNFHRASFDA